MAAGAVLIAFAASSTDARAANEPKQQPEKMEITAHAYRPVQREFSEMRMKQLKLPPGFKINVYAKRMLAVSDDGTVYLTRRDQSSRFPTVTGFLTEDGKAHFGRLCGMALAKDGALLFTDDANGVIYGVTYTGAK